MVSTFGRSVGLSAGRFRLRAGLIGLLLAGLLLSLAGPDSYAATGAFIPGGADSPFGMNIQSAARYMAHDGDDFSVPLNPAQQAGIAWNREEIGWNMVEPTPGNWDWSLTDRAINGSVNRGINVLGLLGYNVDRSQGKARPSFTMPDLGQWANYVSHVVSRYKDRVHYWQIWNEPQDDQYLQGGAGNPGLYAQILSTANGAVKAADPGAKVVTAGFVPVDNGIDWMNRLLSLPGGNQFDIVAVHPYVNDPSRTQPPSMSPERAYWATTDMNQASNFAAKIGKPIWATEFGWSTADSDPGRGRFNHVSPELQADYITRAYVTGLSTSTIQKFFLYQFHEDNTNPNDRYGILDTNWRPTKPGYNAYKNMTARLTGATPEGPVSPFESTNQHTALFGFDGQSGAAVNCGGGQGNATFWNCYASGPSQVNVSLSSERAHNSGQSLRVSYNFGAGTEGRYVVAAPLDSDGAYGQLNAAGSLTKIGMWVYGDGNRTILRLSVTDRNGAESQYDMGRSGPPTAGWQRYEAQLQYPNAGSNPNPQFPLKKFGLILDGRFQTESYSGTVFVDDIYAENTPPVSMYRFASGDRKLDVIWADNTTVGVSLKTTDSQVTIYNRDGNAQTVPAPGGQVTLQASDAPQYVFYHPANVSSSLPPVTNSCGLPDNALRPLFQPTWDRYDAAITSGLTKRSWMWGPTAFRFMREPYDEAPGGCRTVLYWDKSRMEITNPAGNQADKYFVTNGLLAKELVSGQIQLGNSHFVPAPNGAARIPAAGDGANNPKAPTYAAFARVTTLKDGQNWQPNRGTALVTDTLDAVGNPGNNPALGGQNVHLSNYSDVTHHNVADVFWTFMNSRGPIKVGNAFVDGDAVDWIYSIGLPLSEPYWARVTVGGVEKDVLIQVFERRVLTYTPTNSEGFKVEMGNIGGHYATWRYGQAAASLQP